MNNLEQWLLRGILARQVRAGRDHDQRIQQLYIMIREAAEQEFTEDNIPTLNDSLVEWFLKSLRSSS